MAGLRMPSASPRIPSDALIAVVIGAASALLVIAGSWIPSLWGDEAASIMSARRGWSSFFAMLGTVDAVHGLYYTMLRWWIEVAGASPLAVRLPSGLAVGAASAGLFLLVRRRADRITSIMAAGLLAVMPRVAYLATEARSGALALAFAVWLTLAVLVLMDRPAGPILWTAYAAGLAVGATLFLYLVLLIPIHAVAVAWQRSGLDARRIRRFVLAWVAAGILAAPIGILALTQVEQIAFRERRNVVTPESLLVLPWFMLTPLAIVGWLLVAASVVAVVLHRRDPAWLGRRQLLVLSGAWIVVPAVALLGVTATVTHVYTPRYLALSAPAVAVAMAIGVSALSHVTARVVAVTAVVGLAVPAFVDQRTPYAKDGGTDWQTVAEVVDEVARPGDGIVFDEAVRPSRRPRLAMHAYPDGFRGLVDLTLVRPYDETDGLWDVTAPLSTVEDRLDGVDRVIVVTRSRRGTDADVAVLRRHGFELSSMHLVVADRIGVYERVAEGARD